MPLSQPQLDFIEEQLEACLASTTGVYLIECSPSKAKHLQNTIRRITRLSVYDSLQIYKPNEPLYGKSIYQRIITKIVDHGLYLIRVPEPVLDPPTTILDAAITGQERRIHPADRRLLIRYMNDRFKLMHEPALPADIQRKVAVTAIALSDDTLSIQPATIGHVIREVSRDEIASLIRAAQYEENEENSSEPLDNQSPMP